MLIEVGRTGAPGPEDVSVEVVDVEVAVVEDSLVDVELELELVLVLVLVVVLAEGVTVTVTMIVVGEPLAVEVRVLVRVTTVAVAVALCTPANFVSRTLQISNASAPHSHPMLAQTKPGIQHPPPISEGQPCWDPEQAIEPVQLMPSGQHPTGPKPVSVICTHSVPDWQQLLGKPMAEQSDVPVGHANCLFSSLATASLALWNRCHPLAPPSLPLAAKCESKCGANGARNDTEADELAARSSSSSTSKTPFASMAGWACVPTCATSSSPPNA